MMTLKPAILMWLLSVHLWFEMVQAEVNLTNVRYNSPKTGFLIPIFCGEYFFFFAKKKQHKLSGIIQWKYEKRPFCNAFTGKKETFLQEIQFRFLKTKIKQVRQFLQNQTVYLDFNSAGITIQFASKKTYFTCVSRKCNYFSQKSDIFLAQIQTLPFSSLEQEIWLATKEIIPTLKTDMKPIKTVETTMYKIEYTQKK